MGNPIRQPDWAEKGFVHSHVAHPYPRWRPKTTHGNPKVAAVCSQILAVLTLFFWGPAKSPQFSLAQVLFQDHSVEPLQQAAPSGGKNKKERNGVRILDPGAGNNSASQNTKVTSDLCWFLDPKLETLPESFMNDMLWLQG